MEEHSRKSTEGNTEETQKGQGNQNLRQDTTQRHRIHDP